MGIGKISYLSINISRETAIKIETENAHEDYMFVTETRIAVGEEVIRGVGTGI